MKTLQEILDEFSQSKIGKKTEESVNRSVATTLRNKSRVTAITKRKETGYTNEQLIEDWNKGVSFETMLEKSGLKYHGLHTMIYRLKLKRRRPRNQQEEVEQIISLIKKGMTDLEISKIVGKSRGTIYGIRKRKVNNKK